MDDAAIVELAERVLRPRLPIVAGAWKLECAAFKCENGFLSGEIGLNGPPTGEHLYIAVFEKPAEPERLAAYFEGWAAAIARLLRSADAADPELKPAIRFYDLRIDQDPLAGRKFPKAAKTAADFEAALLAPSRWGEHLRADPAALRAFLAKLEATIASVFPAKHKLVEIRAAKPGSGTNPISADPYGSFDGPVVQAHRNGIGVTMELVIYDKPGVLRDLKQQCVTMVPHWAVATCPDRALACVTGLAKTLPKLFAKPGLEVETLMPHDLLDTDVLTQVKPITEHDFAEVFRRRWKV